MAVSNATLSAEYNGVISGDVLIQNGFLDLSKTLTFGTLTINGKLIITSGSNISILTYFNESRGMTINVVGDLQLAGNLFSIIGGDRPKKYPALGLQQTIISCTGVLSGDFDSFHYSLSDELAANASLYMVSYWKENNTVYLRMAPTPRVPPPVPVGVTPHTSVSTGTIIGVVVGGVALIAIVVGFLINGWFCSKKPGIKGKIKPLEPVEMRLSAENVNIGIRESDTCK
eukprot:Phypoly_transcript_05104.p2 GENE.Phypoly_transcript_05104~~Phypoly_transcript_05104.p2  ORF type:complete len:229 (+),score=29.33 Phypoly_transcript_05104:1330-2016(+)